MLLASVSEIREASWAAGLFDGEGYASVVPRGDSGKGRPVMALSMTCFEAVEKFHSIVGVGTLFHEASRKAHHKPALKWQACNRQALLCAEFLYDLVLVKKDDIQKIITHYVLWEKPDHWYTPGQVGPTAKLTEDDVRYIRTSSEKGADLAAKFGVTRFAISNVKTRKTWAHVEG